MIRYIGKCSFSVETLVSFVVEFSHCSQSKLRVTWFESDFYYKTYDEPVFYQHEESVYYMRYLFLSSLS